jgi:hypothetical protein
MMKNGPRDLARRPRGVAWKPIDEWRGSHERTRSEEAPRFVSGVPTVEAGEGGIQEEGLKKDR